MYTLDVRSLFLKKLKDFQVIQALLLSNMGLILTSDVKACITIYLVKSSAMHAHGAFTHLGWSVRSRLAQ